MKIAIAGAGAMGSRLGIMLHRCNIIPKRLPIAPAPAIAIFMCIHLLKSSLTVIIIQQLS